MRWRWLLVAGLLAGLAGCGNAAPTVENMRVSQRNITRGQEFFVTLMGVHDPDGDVYRGKVKLKFSSVDRDGDIELKDELDIFEPDRSSDRGDVIVGINVFGSMRLGDYEVEAVFEDQGGTEADPKVLQVAVIR